MIMKKYTSSETTFPENSESCLLYTSAGEKYFLGAATNEEAREVTVALDFLEKDKTYRAVIYADGKDADLSLIHILVCRDMSFLQM